MNETADLAAARRFRLDVRLIGGRAAQEEFERSAKAKVSALRATTILDLRVELLPVGAVGDAPVRHALSHGLGAILKGVGGLGPRGERVRWPELRLGRRVRVDPLGGAGAP